MADLSRGANAPLPTAPVQLAVSGARQGAVDLMVFQLGADRKVRTDADFVFFNQPTSPEGAVALVAADRVTADLTRVPADVDMLAVAVALDDAVPGSLATIPGLGVAVTGPGTQVNAPAVGLTSERAAVLVELYRRQGGWKVRNVSAGWAAGLPSLAREHGVAVDEAPASPAPVPPGAAPAAFGAADVLPSPYVSPPAASGSSPVPPAGSGSYPPPPAAVPVAAGPGPGAVPAGPLPPPGQFGGWPPPGGSLPPYANPSVPAQVGGWAPPGGSLPGH